VIPFVVTLGWAMGKPLTLFFDAFESAALFLAVLTVNYAIQDGKSNWSAGPHENLCDRADRAVAVQARGRYPHRPLCDHRDVYLLLLW
jgi:hypothetical protein